ncbi:LPXTG cell wall anchor domain-containing protein [Corynebacterium diphtheriae]|uniref:LPXTG cell wall anchor domain-containing protein n=1 Tax=Corynebacterium diphtheriae TaxID=1717 RepID=UPI001ED92EEC|nr:LPXTG cell wall anchor domain-containing protein [Corynebacterium diphtheriae]
MYQDGRHNRSHCQRCQNGTLPKTGSTGFLPFVFVGLSIIVLTALWVQRRSQYKL